MSDLISREAVLDALRNLSFEHIFQCGEYYGEDVKQLTIINAEKAIDVIESLTSIEPERTVKKDINIGDKETVLIEPFDANLTHVGYCMCGELVNIDYSYCPKCGRKIEWRRMT